eukprot:SAG22_NODE_152_length_17377_cov_191.856928_7_plen_248_part_00
MHRIALNQTCLLPQWRGGGVAGAALNRIALNQTCLLPQMERGGNTTRAETQHGLLLEHARSLARTCGISAPQVSCSTPSQASRVCLRSSGGNRQIGHPSGGCGQRRERQADRQVDRQTAAGTERRTGPWWRSGPCGASRPARSDLIEIEIDPVCERSAAFIRVDERGERREEGQRTYSAVETPQKGRQKERQRGTGCVSAVCTTVRAGRISPGGRSGWGCSRPLPGSRRRRRAPVVAVVEPQGKARS